jgi:signal transduction histidine kinase
MSKQKIAIWGGNMTVFNDLMTGTKLTATFLLIALIIVAVAIEGYYSVKLVSENMASMYEDRLLPSQQLWKMNGAQYKLKVDLGRLILLSDDRVELERDMARQIQIVDRYLKLYAATYLVPEEKEALDRFKPAWSNYLDAVADEVRLVKLGDTKSAIRSLRSGGKVFTAQRAVDSILTDLSEIQSRVGTKLMQQGERRFNQTIWTMTISGALAVLLAVALGFTISRSITLPLSTITSVARNLSEGDMDTGSLSSITSRRDEIGVLARTFTLMADQLKETLEGLHRSHVELERRVQERTSELQESNEKLGIEVEERRQAEAKLQLRSQELARSNTELEQFAYVASHDLQEPLRMVASYVQLIEKRYKDKLDADGREFVEFAVDGAKRMRVLIEDLLAYSRVTTRAEPFQPTNFEEVLEIVTDNLQVAIQDSGAQITHSPLPTVQGDTTQLTQLFQNLISNAIKFRGDVAPEVHVNAETQDGYWLITIQDNGIGIEAQHLDRIFVLFQRLHGRGSYPGTGLGLAICRKIVERHGGTIWVESETGTGSKFNFTIPKKGETSS